jgi:hypothetical protein
MRSVKKTTPSKSGEDETKARLVSGVNVFQTKTGQLNGVKNHLAQLK